MKHADLDLKNIYTESYVAFIDILGFSNLVKTGNIKRIISSLTKLSERKKLIEKDNGSIGGDNVTVSAFSDSIFISTPSIHDGARKICYYSGFLAKELLDNSVLCRGAIIRGEIYHQDGICFGPGLITAYQLETSTAIYPRIIVSDDVVDSFYGDYTKSFSIDPKTNRYFLKGDDGLNYIDVFDIYYHYWGVSGEYEFSQSDRDRLSSIISALENEAASSDRTRAKLMWLRNSFQRACRRHPIVWPNDLDECGLE